MQPFQRRAGRLVGATFLIYAVLVATHAGEFWPFSIYPMFSQAGRPWSRAVVRQVEADSVRWQPAAEAEALPGEPFAMEPRGIDPIDLANFVSKTERWDAGRRAGLQRMFHDQLGPPPPEEPEEDGARMRDAAARAEAEPPAQSRRLLVVRVNGRLLESDSVALEFVPYALLRPDTTLLNPRLAQ